MTAIWRRNRVVKKNEINDHKFHKDAKWMGNKFRLLGKIYQMFGSVFPVLFQTFKN